MVSKVFFPDNILLEYLGLLNFPDVDACVHDLITIQTRKYKYAPAYIEFDLVAGYFSEFLP